MYCRALAVEYEHMDVWTHGRSEFNIKWAKVSPKTANLASNLRHVGAKWAKLGQIGFKLKQNSTKLVPSWSNVAPSRLEVAPNWLKLVQSLR